jgi:hypothetical protein
MTEDGRWTLPEEEEEQNNHAKSFERGMILVSKYKLIRMTQTHIHVYTHSHFYNSFVP